MALDFINNLYYHYRHHKRKTPDFSRTMIPRSKFTYDNIQKNLGIARYSTSFMSSILKYVPKDNQRQNLFVENYIQIKNILANANNLDDTQVQENIEYLLYNQ